MKPKKKYVLLGVGVILIIALYCINHIAENLYARKKIYININEEYMRYLYINGECDYKIETVVIKNKEITKMNQLYIDVSFYNLHNEHYQTDVEQLLQEYENFCNNKGTWEHLEAYYDFQFGEYQYAGEYFEYDFCVKDFVTKKYAISYRNASLEQLLEGIEYASNELYYNNSN